MTKAPPPSEDLIRHLSEFDLKVGELALALREMILEELPAASERIFRAYALVFWYSLSGKMADAFCTIVVNRAHVNLMFNRGAELQDPAGLLVGSGKIIRHLKVKRPEDLKLPHLRKFIRAAIKHSRAIAAARPKDPLTRSRVRATAKRRTVK
jgi:hypothetical protein